MKFLNQFLTQAHDLQNHALLAQGHGPVRPPRPAASHGHSSAGQHASTAALFPGGHQSGNVSTGSSPNPNNHSTGSTGVNSEYVPPGHSSYPALHLGGLAPNPMHGLQRLPHGHVATHSAHPGGAVSHPKPLSGHHPGGTSPTSRVYGNGVTRPAAHSGGGGLAIPGGANLAGNVAGSAPGPAGTATGGSDLFGGGTLDDFVNSYINGQLMPVQAQLRGNLAQNDAINTAFGQQMAGLHTQMQAPINTLQTANASAAAARQQSLQDLAAQQAKIYATPGYQGADLSQVGAVSRANAAGSDLQNSQFASGLGATNDSFLTQLQGAQDSRHTQYARDQSTAAAEKTAEINASKPDVRFEYGLKKQSADAATADAQAKQAAADSLTGYRQGQLILGGQKLAVDTQYKNADLKLRGEALNIQKAKALAASNPNLSKSWAAFSKSQAAAGGSQTQYTYDDQGNRISSATAPATWDPFVYHTDPGQSDDKTGDSGSYVIADIARQFSQSSGIPPAQAAAMVISQYPDRYASLVESGFKLNPLTLQIEPVKKPKPAKKPKPKH